MSASTLQFTSKRGAGPARQINLTCAFLVWLIHKGLLLALPGLAVLLLLAAPSAAPTKYIMGLAAHLAAHLLALGCAWVYLTRLGRLPFWRTLGWDWGTYGGFTPSGRQGLALTVCVACGVLGLANFVGGAFANPGQTRFDALKESSVYVRMIIVLLSVVSAPFIEEVVYRGILFPALRRSAGVLTATLLVTLLFAVVHVGQYNLPTGLPNWGVIVPIAVTGLCLTGARAATGRLLPCVVMHATCNALVALRFDLLPILRHCFG